MSDNGGKIKTYKFQLDQVREQLVRDPENASLKEVERKLQRLIDLASSFVKEQPPLTATPKPLPKVAAKRHEKVIELVAGDACEVKADGKWFEAIIQSVSGDRHSCTVLFTGTAEAQHCTVEEVRKHDPLTAKRRPPVESAVQRPSHVNPDSRVPQPPAKKKGTKAEYIQKKEEEQRQKQESWQSFQMRLKGKR
jgi:hypothetical protein